MRLQSHKCNSSHKCASSVTTCDPGHLLTLCAWYCTFEHHLWCHSMPIFNTPGKTYLPGMLAIIRLRLLLETTVRPRWAVKATHQFQTLFQPCKLIDQSRSGFPGHCPNTYWSSTQMSHQMSCRIYDQGPLTLKGFIMYGRKETPWHLPMSYIGHRNHLLLPQHTCVVSLVAIFLLQLWDNRLLELWIPYPSFQKKGQYDIRICKDIDSGFKGGTNLSCYVVRAVSIKERRPQSAILPMTPCPVTSPENPQTSSTVFSGSQSGLLEQLRFMGTNSWHVSKYAALEDCAYYIEQGVACKVLQTCFALGN
jgi:hypothetical protein